MKRSSFVLLMIFLGVSLMTREALAYAPGNFFLQLTSSYADFDYANATFILKNPTPLAVAVNPLNFNFFIKSNSTPSSNLKISILKDVFNSENVTDYSLKVNGNSTSYDPSGWHWENKTVKSFVPISSETINTNANTTILVETNYVGKFGLNSRDWIPYIIVNSVRYEMDDWAWWNTSFSWRYPIIENITTPMVVSINNTYGVGGTIYWANLTNDSYVYTNNTTSNWFPLDIGNEVSGNKYYNSSSANSGRNPYNVWNSSVVLAMHFDEGSGNSPKDMSLPASNGTASATTMYNTSGKYNRALRFSGSTSVTMNATTELSGAGKTAWSWGAWVKTDSTGTYRRIISMDDSGGSSGVYVLRMSSTNRFNAQVSLANGTNNIACDGTVTTITLGTWYHVMAVYNSTHLIVYVNGAPDCTTGGFGGQALQTDTDATTIGMLLGDYEFWAGLIDEPRIYNVSLSQEEVRREYWMGINNLTRLGTAQSSAGGGCTPGSCQYNLSGALAMTLTNAGAKRFTGNRSDSLSMTLSMLESKILNARRTDVLGMTLTSSVSRIFSGNRSGNLPMTLTIAEIKSAILKRADAISVTLSMAESRLLTANRSGNVPITLTEDFLKSLRKDVVKGISMTLTLTESRILNAQRSGVLPITISELINATKIALYNQIDRLASLLIQINEDFNAYIRSWEDVSPYRVCSILEQIGDSRAYLCVYDDGSWKILIKGVGK